MIYILSCKFCMRNKVSQLARTVHKMTTNASIYCIFYIFQGACVFVASLVHYLYLASFCWMLMEGVYLYRMVVKVFDAGLKMRVAYLFSYGK